MINSHPEMSSVYMSSQIAIDWQLHKQSAEWHACCIALHNATKPLHTNTGDYTIMRNAVLRLLQIALIVIINTGATGMAAAAEDNPTFIIELKDGAITPDRIEVPAGKKIVLEVRNTGKTAVEFESKPLKKEVIIAPGGKSSVTLRKLEPGEYSFFDEFHEGAKGVLVAK